MASKKLAALVLAALAPLVGEYLLGNVSSRLLLGLPFLMPMYGGGALLIREIARRTGRGYGTMLALAGAYGVIEAGAFDGSLFNSGFGGLDFGAMFSPWLGFSPYYAFHFAVGHAIWSITVPIALTEAVFPAHRATPWLGRIGLAITAVVYVLGGLLILNDSRRSGDYRTTAAQLTGVLAAAGLLVVLAFTVRWRPRPLDRPLPRPLWFGVGAFVTTSLVYASPESWPGLAGAAAVLVIAVLSLVLAAASPSWTPMPVVAVAGGALLTYVWGGFVVLDLYGRTGAVDIAGNFVLSAGAVLLIVVAARRTARFGLQSAYGSAGSRPYAS
jgi:hypothetical protein